MKARKSNGEETYMRISVTTMQNEAQNSKTQREPYLEGTFCLFPRGFCILPPLRDESHLRVCNSHRTHERKCPIHPAGRAVICCDLHLRPLHWLVSELGQ